MIEHPARSRVHGITTAVWFPISSAGAVCFMTQTERFIAVRNILGWTRTEMAKRVGVSTSLVSLWESGNRKIHEEHLLKLSAVSGMSLDYILNVETVANFRTSTNKDRMFR